MLRQVCRSAALCLLLTGCGEITGTVVDMQTAEVSNLLYHLPSKADLMEMPFLSPAASRTIDQIDTGVIWTYAINRKPVCLFTAHIKEDTSSTSVVWTDVAEVSGDGESPMCDRLEIAGPESVAAALEGRAADRSMVERRIAAMEADQ